MAIFARQARRRVRRYSSPGKRRALYERQGGFCFWCRRRMTPLGDPGPMSAQATFDHLVPRCDGGSNAIGNLVLACFGCNNRRGSTPAGVYRIMLSTCGLPEARSVRGRPLPAWAIRLSPVFRIVSPPPGIWTLADPA